MFPGSIPGKAISLPCVLTQFRLTVARSGLARPVRFHSFRHAFATHQLERGVDLVTLQAMMGHQCLSTTLVYLRVRTDHLLAAGSPLDHPPAT